MKRTVVLGLAAVSFVLSTVPLSPAGAAPRKVIRVYEGTTSDGGRILMLTSVRDGVVRFQGLGLTTDAVCADGTTLPVENGLDFAPRGLAMDPAALDVSRVYLSDAFSLTGAIGARSGAGTVRYVVAALDAAEEPQLCTTGELTWTAERVATESPLVSGSTILMQEVPGGTRMVALDPDGAGSRVDARAAAERLRTYEGEMSSGDPFFVVTARRPEGVVLNELGLAWDLACDDGTVFGLGFFIFFSGEPLEPGRLDHAISAPALALHINGTLDGHLGAGTSSTVVPALTEDLAAQGCRTGDLTWRAWRIDAGY